MVPYILKTFRGGISDESDKGVSGAFKHGYGLKIHDRDDVLMCSSTMATINESTVTDLIQFFVPASDGSVYAFGNTGSIYAISGDYGDPAVSFVYNDENGKIRGAAEWQESSGSNYLYWATNSSIARVQMNGSLPVPWGGGVATQDYKTTLDPAEWHTMGMAAGQLNIANRNYLASITFEGDFNPAALNIRPGNLIKTLEERDDFVILGSYREDNSEEGHIWSWITTAQNWVQKKKIPVKGVNALISAELMLLQGGSDGEMFFSDFVNAVPLHGVPLGGQAAPGGVSIEDDVAVFGIYGGSYPGIWSYGRKRKNRPFALNYQYRLAKGVAGSLISTIGAIANINGLILASWGTTDESTSDYGIDMVSSTTRASAIYEGLEFDANIPHAKKPFNTVKLVMQPYPTGGSTAVKFKMDNESAWRYAVMGDGNTTFSVAGETEALFSILKPAKTFEVGVELTPGESDTPKINAVITYVDNAQYEY